ncbi:alpha/beta hydrolase [Paenibacillus glacialis]|uniref:Esterase n=1 Tax=Paenibacillus glacialis TaxID=494026 RepID=A0A168BZL4_9BACL|nr:alpha/beta hydrolase family protein [Paenibacillus glacialis]OAB32917.1 esterase [Paenibacillus glacialis]
MAVIQCQFYSEAINLSMGIHVIIPQNAAIQASGSAKLPVLYLLHGLSADHTDWIRHSFIERYAENKGIVVVMPSVGRSYYTDMKYGSPYFTFLSEELPEIVRALFPVSERREDTFVAGMSMGGYGALKLALSFPERYAAAASLSGGLDIVSRMNGANNFQPHELIAIFGDVAELKGSTNDLFYLLDKLKAYDGDKPMLYQCCGTEDFLYADNQTFRKYALDLGIEVTYDEGPGEHDWDYWDPQIQRVLDWLPIG